MPVLDLGKAFSMNEEFGLLICDLENENPSLAEGAYQGFAYRNEDEEEGEFRSLCGMPLRVVPRSWLHGH